MQGANITNQWTPGELLSVAKWQRYTIWMVLLQLLSGAISIVMSVGGQTSGAQSTASTVAGLVVLGMLVMRIVVIVLSIYGVYMMAKALKNSLAILYVILMLIPLVSLITLLSLNASATNTLQSNGIKVGFMGVSQSDLDRLGTPSADMV